mmetsp:Transcript_55853/g.127029  ORF Transcript_55853/g.127029 Transcript_55853/m.127029 type:complete len:373 (+) Transcript_55853:933-2051(+)
MVSVSQPLCKSSRAASGWPDHPVAQRDAVTVDCRRFPQILPRIQEESRLILLCCEAEHASCPLRGAIDIPLCQLPLVKRHRTELSPRSPAPTKDPVYDGPRRAFERGVRLHGFHLLTNIFGSAAEQVLGLLRCIQPQRHPRPLVKPRTYQRLGDADHLFDCPLSPCNGNAGYASSTDGTGKLLGCLAQVLRGCRDPLRRNHQRRLREWGQFLWRLAVGWNHGVRMLRLSQRVRRWNPDLHALQDVGSWRQHLIDFFWSFHRYNLHLLFFWLLCIRVRIERRKPGLALAVSILQRLGSKIRPYTTILAVQLERSSPSVGVFRRYTQPDQHAGVHVQVRTVSKDLSIVDLRWGRWRPGLLDGITILIQLNFPFC